MSCMLMHVFVLGSLVDSSGCRRTGGGGDRIKPHGDRSEERKETLKELY